MPDPMNILTDDEKQASQKLWDERLAAIKTVTTDACAHSLKTIRLQGKLYEDMLNNPRMYGNRSIVEIAADFQCTESALY